MILHPYYRRSKQVIVGTIATIALLLIFTGCRTSFKQYARQGFKLGPDYATPQVNTAVDWIDSEDQRVTMSDPVDTKAYWASFGDPVLSDLVDEARSQNLSLRQAGERILQARAIRNIQVGRLLPQRQSFGGSYSRNAFSKDRANSSNVQKQFFDQWDTGFNLSWELDFWGRYRRAIEAADADLDSSILNYGDVLVTLTADTASTYVLLRTFQSQVEIAQANIELQQETLRLANARYQAGQTSELDVSQAQSNLSQTRASIHVPQIEIRKASLALSVLLACPPEDLVTRIGVSPIPAAPRQLAVGIPAHLICRRPDVRRAERICAKQSAKIGIAESDLYPSLAVNGSLGWTAEDLDQLLDSRAFSGSIVPQFSWNILNYGRIQNGILLQDAVFRESVLAYQQTVLEAQREVEEGLVTFLQSQQRSIYLKESVDASEKAVKISLAQFAEGTTDFNRVLLVQSKLVEQQNFLALARGDITQGIIQVYRALGGGWTSEGCYSPPTIQPFVTQPLNELVSQPGTIDANEKYTTLQVVTIADSPISHEDSPISHEVETKVAVNSQLALPLEIH